MARQATHGNVQARKKDAVLFLRVDPVMRTGRMIKHGSGIRCQLSEQFFNLVAELFMTHLIQVEAEASFGSCISLAVVTPQADDGIRHLADFIRLHPGVERNGISIHLGGKNPADPDAETHHPVVFNGVKGYVVMKQEVVFGASNCGIPLSRQIGIFGVPLVVVGEEILKFSCVRPRIHDLVGIDPG